MRDFVIDLGVAGDAELGLVGGKAKNLGEMLRARLPVPPGFCVTTEAYREVAAGAELDFPSLAKPEPSEASRLAAAAREALLRALVPFDIERAVKEAYPNTGSPRSSVSSARHIRSKPRRRSASMGRVGPSCCAHMSSNTD